MSSNAPPPPNPVLSAYERFVLDTPLVTRYSMTTLFVSWCLSWFFNPEYSLGNIPYFTLYRLEIYRIFLSPLVCQKAFNLIFAYLSFVESGKRLEFSMGSTAFAWLMFTIGCFTNCLFLVVCLAMNYVTEDSGWLMASSSGIWVVLFGIIAIECSKAPGLKRQLFFFEVPTKYYPLALFAFFSLVGSFSVAYLTSIGVGHLYGHERLNVLKVSQARFNRWEETILANFTRRQGWVVGHAAIGDAAWSNETQGNSNGLGGMLQRLRQQMGDEESGVDGAPGSVTAPPDPAAPISTETHFPTSGGQTLGGASRRPASDSRAAALAAAERRSTGQAVSP